MKRQDHDGRSHLRLAPPYRHLLDPTALALLEYCHFLVARPSPVGSNPDEIRHHLHGAANATRDTCYRWSDDGSEARRRPPNCILPLCRHTASDLPRRTTAVPVLVTEPYVFDKSGKEVRHYTSVASTVIR